MRKTETESTSCQLQRVISGRGQRQNEKDRDRTDVLSTAEGHLRMRTGKDRERTDILSVQRVTSGRSNSVTSKCMQESAYLIMSPDL